MITIALDESGTFENAGSAVKLIGGMIYHGDDSEEEMQRLEEFYISFCHRNSISYPQDLHGIDMNRTPALRSIKASLKKELLAYFQRSGCYHFTCMIKSRQDRTDFINISNLVHDHTASNLYEHMINQTLQNLIFYNPVLDTEDQLMLEIATRSFPVPLSDTDAIHKYEDLGYSYRDHYDKRIFYLTDQKTFKTALAVKMMESRIQRPIQVDLNVQRINYTTNAKRTPYLYTADLACDIIRDYIQVAKPDFNLLHAATELQKLTGNEPLIWAYDDIDGIWQQFYLACSRRNYIEALVSLYQIRQHSSPFRGVYERHCLPMLQTRLHPAFDIRKLDIYEEELSFMFIPHQRTDEPAMDTDCGIFAGEDLWERIREHADSEFIRKRKYRLADMLMRGFNHKGNTARASYFYQYCLDHRDAVSPEDYCGTALTAAQILVNWFDYDGAIQIVEQSYEQLKKLKTVYSEMSSGNGQGHASSRYPLFGKLLSSLGQFYAFKRQKEDALLFFEEALQEFEAGSSDYNKTLSFILHLALDHKDRELYRCYEEAYFRAEGIYPQLQAILQEQDAFRMFVWAKALYVWPDPDQEAEAVQQLKSVDFGTMKGFAAHLHPWQLIYKYLSLLMFRHGHSTSSRLYASRIEQVGGAASNTPDTTIRLTGLYSSLTLSRITDSGAHRKPQNKLMLKELIHKLSALQPAHYWNIEEEDLLNQMQSLFRYMYH